MKTGTALALCFALAWAHPVAAQGDERIVMLEAGANARWHLPTCSQTAQTILLPSGEIIRSVIISEPAAYAAGISGTGDSLTLVPSGQIVPAVMTVQTDRNSYEFDLAPASPAEAPLVVRIGQAASAELPGATTEPATLVDTGQYGFSGERNLRPAVVSDDGDKTYIQWARDQAMSAVFAIGPSGEEEMVEGHMRDGVFTIDRVYDRLVFRIDRDKATATRLAGRGGK